MDIEAFRGSTSKETPPAGLSAPLQALWRASKGDWDGAHALVQDESSFDAAWVHGYLHRVEGDPSNAGYWYRRAGKPAGTGSLEEEWQAIVSTLLIAGQNI